MINHAPRPTQQFRSFASRVVKLALIAAAIPTLSCAKLPPGSSSLSGRQITVRITFASLPQSAYYYFFCINRYGPTGTTTANGPVAVLGPAASQNLGYGNGFVTGSSASTVGSISGTPDYGVTDFVLYNGNVGTSTNVGLYHFNANTNPNQQTASPNIPIQPLNVTLPNDIASPNTISFTIDMDQLVTDTTDPATKKAEALAIRYLQVNIIATNTISTTPSLKEVDAMGDGRNASEFSSFLVIDLNQSNSYLSNSIYGILTPEPTGDVYTNQGTQGDPALDITSWEIDVQPGSGN